jgi:hypothetical protein
MPNEWNAEGARSGHLFTAPAMPPGAEVARDAAALLGVPREGSVDRKARGRTQLLRFSRITPSAPHAISTLRRSA